jgi:asparagine N-glycosylation enzyme membrane subunit Stt3
MEKLIPPYWYLESPIDFEHKQYILYDYLQNVDNNFKNKILSPYLLHMERLIDELNSVNSSFRMMKKYFDKNRYFFLKEYRIDGEDEKTIREIKEIVNFAIPQIDARIKTGYIILRKNQQILY